MFPPSSSLSLSSYSSSPVAIVAVLFVACCHRRRRRISSRRCPSRSRRRHCRRRCHRPHRRCRRQSRRHHHCRLSCSFVARRHRRRRCVQSCHSAASFAFVIAPLPVLHLLLRRRCLPCRAAAAFVIALPLASSSHRCSIFDLLPPRSPQNRSNRTPLTSPSGITFSSLRCCHQPKPSYCATAAFLTLPLTSSSSHHSLNCRTTFPFIVAPPVLPSSLR